MVHGVTSRLYKRTAHNAELLQRMAKMSTTQKIVRQKMRAAMSATRNAVADSGCTVRCTASAFPDFLLGASCSSPSEDLCACIAIDASVLRLL